jgi:phosphoribosyl 1,2-cyclic phosphodiesterase
VFGGWTTCAHVETADGFDIVFDCGSGFRNCAADLQTKWGDRRGRELHIFGSHSHLDHTEGFEQAAVCFDPRNTIHIYGNRQFLGALDSNLGIFTRHVARERMGVQTPIFYAIMPAHFRATEIRGGDEPAERTPAACGPGAPVSVAVAPAPRAPAPPAPAPGEPGPDALAQRVHRLEEPIVLGATRVQAFEVFHPAPCLAYRVEHGGKAFVFCTDHELRRGREDDHPCQRASLEAEGRVQQHSAGADLLYRDGQYLREEYDGRKGIGKAGPAPRLDWGHSCLEDVVEIARGCAVKRALIGHHDPNREWAERNRLDVALRQDSAAGGTALELARAETVVDL